MSRLLVVEDSPTVVQSLIGLLEPKGFTVDVANDGLSAFAALMQARPDLIMLDIGLPGIDGLNLCTAIRNRSGFETVPIIIVTGSHKSLDRSLATLFGADHYITKPYNEQELMTVITQCLQISQPVK